ncbi:MAG: hypothetical protein C0399_08595 [Syntrophus sp. (in: bacteria)]|nr:hypothetical protein [Syntrophus sp. (in: bacteria)]
MSDRDPMVRLFHMCDYAAKIGALIAGKNKADVEQDEVLCLAVTRLIELIGEAANQYPKELQIQYPQIPWAKIHQHEEQDSFTAMVLSITTYFEAL